MLQKLIEQVAKNNEYINTYNARIDELQQDIKRIAGHLANPYAYGVTFEQFVSDSARIAELYATMQEYIDEIERLEKENQMLQEDIAELESEVN